MLERSMITSEHILLPLGKFRLTNTNLPLDASRDSHDTDRFCHEFGKSTQSGSWKHLHPVLPSLGLGDFESLDVKLACASHRVTYVDLWSTTSRERW